MLDRKPTDDNGPSHAIDTDPREQLDRLAAGIRSMIFRRTLEVELLQHALDSVRLANELRRDWTSDVVARYLRQLVESINDSAVRQ